MATAEYISGKVSQLVKKYRTRDPFEICDELKIKVRYKDLGKSLKAFYFYQSRIKNIVINTHSGNVAQKILCAHELGHAVLHGELAALRGFRELSLFDTDVPTEYEANLFAAELLIGDKEFIELLNDDSMSIFKIANELSVPVELLYFKILLLRSKGFKIEPPVIFRSDFLKNNID